MCQYRMSRPVALHGKHQAHANCVQAVGPVAVTSLLLGEGLPKVVGLPEQEDPNNPAEPDIQAVYNRTAIQARRAPATAPRGTFRSSTQRAAQQLWLAHVCCARHMYI